MKRLLAKLICRLRGHDFGPCVYLSPAVLQCCLRCGDDIMGRTIDDLEPATDVDFAVIESLDERGLA